MNRRNAGLALLALLAAGAAPVSVRAQQAGVYRVGYLSTPTRESVERGLDAFLRKLRELGWVEGQNLVIEYRWAEGKVERLPDLAAELVRRKVEVIVAPAGSAALAAKNATSSIPIVMIFPSDPVEMGLVASLSRPGGNLTGTTLTPGPEEFDSAFSAMAQERAGALLVAGTSTFLTHRARLAELAVKGRLPTMYS